MAKRNSDLENIEEFKNCLISRATGHEIDEERYKDLRKNIVGNPIINNDLPTFIKTCHTPDEFWIFIKAKDSTYAGRRKIINEEIDPLLKKLDEKENTLEEYLKVGERIGGGGFGEVFKVHHDFINMDFSIKVFSPFLDNGDSKLKDRFFREARILFKLNHPNIVRIFDTGLLRGKPFIRMEFIDGSDLNRLLIDKGSQNPDDALKIVMKIASAIEHAHGIDSGIIHRDLKPSNVMISKDGQVKVVDFGQSIFVENDIVSRITRTNEHAVGGLFIAPELNHNPMLIDVRTDIYSIGAFWYFLLSGRAPAGTNISHTLLQSCPEISQVQLTMILKCLADSDSRYSSVGDLLKEMRSVN